MWFIDMNGKEDDSQFLRNIRIASEKSNGSKNSPGRILDSFILDLSFWGSSDCDPSRVTTKTKRKSARTASSNKKNTCVTSRVKTCKNRDRPYARSDSEESNDSLSKRVWKTAVDPSTGRTYYYDAITRKTQWHKPAELKALEKRKKEERRKKDLGFFREMEQNIRDSRARSELIPGIPLAAFVPQGPPQGPQRSPRVRTISGMDDVLLAELRGGGSIVQHQQKQRQNATTIQTMTTDKFGKPPLPSGTIGSRPSLTKTLNSMELSPDRKSLQHTIEQVHPFRRCESVELMGEKLLDCPIITEQSLSELENKSPPSHTRRNTGGTIYIQNTMTNPDIQATIKCVCGVYRAHIVQAAERKSMRSPVSVNDITFDTDVFSDDYGARKRRKKKTPSLAEVLAFYDEFYRRSRMEHDAIIMSLIYVERLVKGTNGVVSPTPENWRSILFACMVLASKVWDDLSMWNVDFSNVSAHTAGLASFTLKRINQLELALLKSLNFDVKVPASEYAKYYFLIRTMLIRSGLVKEIEKPLGKEEAFNKLETRASDYQNTKLCRPSHSRRVKSLDGTVSTWLVGDKESSGPVLRDTVCLEQIIVG